MMETKLNTELEVLDYLKRELYTFRDENYIMTYYSISIKDIIKYIETPEKCGNWPFEFVCRVNQSIQKIKKQFLIPYSEIEQQTEEDRVLSKLLLKNNCMCFDTNMFFKYRVSIRHVIQYMQRSEEIKNWNAYFLNCVKKETERVKDFLL